MLRSNFSFIFIFLNIFSCVLMGQSSQSISTDRPDQTESPNLVPSKYFQMECGLTYEKLNKDFTSIAHPTCLLRYGVNERFELRLVAELLSNKSFGVHKVVLPPIEIGFKTHLVEEKDWIPKISFIGHLVIPKLASPTERLSNLATSFRFTLQHSLSNRFSLGYNLGAAWDGENTEASFVYTLSLGMAFLDKLSSYIELYGFVPDGMQEDHRIDAGFVYLINSNLQLDLSGGLGLSPSSPKYFVGLGVSYRYKT